MTITQKDKYEFDVTALLFYIQCSYCLNESHVFFEYLLPHNILGSRIKWP